MKRPIRRARMLLIRQNTGQQSNGTRLRIRRDTVTKRILEFLRMF